MSETPTSRADTGTSPALAVTGLLGLAAVFLGANPRYGVMLREWPWTAFRTADDRLIQVTFALWILTSMAALTLAFFDDRSTRSTVLMVLGTPLITTAAATGAAFPFQAYFLGEMLALILLGGGMWHLSHSGARRGRAIVWVAGAVFLWTLVASKDANSADTRLVVLCKDLVALLEGKTLRPGTPDYLVTVYLPYLLITTAAVIGVLHALIRSKWLSRIGWLCLAVGVVFPIGAAIGTAGRFDTDVYTRALFDGLTGYGIVLWLLGSFVIDDALEERPS